MSGSVLRPFLSLFFLRQDFPQFFFGAPLMVVAFVPRLPPPVAALPSPVYQSESFFLLFLN